MNLEPMQRVAVLIEALPYIQRFSRKIVVMRYGGSVMMDEELRKEVIQDVMLLKLTDFKSVIVYRGGKEISHWVGKVGMEARLKNRLRVIDEPTMKTAEMVLDKANKSLVQLVSELGINAVGTNSKDGMVLKCHEKYAGDEDIGFVGDMGEVSPEIIYNLPEKDSLPIIYPIGSDENFLSYNINADDAVCVTATAVEAEKLASLTDVEDVYKDHEDKSSLISEMTVEEAQNFVDSGMLEGGMLPKPQNYINVMKSGISRVHILDGRIPHCLLLEVLTDKGIGTAIYNSEEDERYYHD